MKPDVAARVIGIVALVIALLNIGVTWILWLQSGPRIRVRFWRDERPSDWFLIDVANVGRMAVLVKSIGLEDRITTSSPANTISYISMSVTPEGLLPRVLEHTDLPVRAEVPMDQVVQRWFGGK